MQQISSHLNFYNLTEPTLFLAKNRAINHWIEFSNNRNIQILYIHRYVTADVQIKEDPPPQKKKTTILSTGC